MRVILFRGKRLDNGEWAYGVPLLYSGGQVGIVRCTTETRILPYEGDLEFHYVEELMSPKVDPATIGQDTGLTDSNGKKIFDGDILLFQFEQIGEQLATVEWSKKYAGFKLKPKDDFQYADIQDGKVIGNIHDNFGLLIGDCNAQTN